ncbi:lipid IV(A) 3-deoxy-D-manno-octulosonic acid transferase [Legionella fairfieldensis]|uniref:lipid IV(A) 3-deoxy-D-manno-octulosonic acid transferase n=1 Tax=Legionella fairfieldensis TaxID=45064 RepID=UPI00048BB829|nr:lipid IV(A) 3-deoxy-D-manno-octulosonic acid transferase [Legionella fairfieldensis]
MRLIYSLLMYLLTPYLLVRLWWKGRRLPAYRHRIAERFSLDAMPEKQVDIWIHAVSLGEVIAVTPLIDALLDEKKQILVTTMTPTGSKQVETRFGSRVMHRYVPYDLPCILRRFFSKVKPRLGLIVETELWPNLIYYATKTNMPLFLVNARLSERSYRNYKKAAFLFKSVLNQFTNIFAQSDDDARRFKRLGVDAAKVAVPGNMKFDLQTQNIEKALFLTLKNYWGAHRPIVTIASTHEDEEQQVLSCLRQLQQGLPGVILLIAPRHPERFQKVYQLSKQQGFNTGLRSQIDTLNESNDVVILDSLGELLGFYQISDYAFVGGSFVPVGGHNVLEPIAMKVPVFSGPHVHNFKTICRELKEAQAIGLVENAEHLVQRIIALSQNETEKQTLVDRATQVLTENKGAIKRYLDKITFVLD